MSVAIVGGGPTGLMAACELALAGVDCTLVEKRATEPNITRAFVLHARALEILDARGLADPLVKAGHPLPRPRTEYLGEIDLTEMDTRFPMMLLVPQNGTEQVLTRRALELGVRIVRGAEVVSLEQDVDEARLGLTDGTRLRASYVVGADGAHSTVRELLGVGFVGERYSVPMVLADVRIPELDGLAAPISQAGPEGVVVTLPFGDGWFRVGYWLSQEPASADDPAPDIDQIRAVFTRIAGTDHGMTGPRWISRFVSQRRQAERYRAGRVFLAGDAAHVNSPIGGQGMNTGLQDAANLGWKLAATHNGWAPSWLLDSYHTERHPVGERTLALTDRLTRSVVHRSRLSGLATRGLIEVIGHIGPMRRRLLSQVTGLGIAYPAAESGAHRLAGHRAPDWDTETGRLYEQLRDGKFVLAGAAETIAVRQDTVARVGRPRGKASPATALIRPDGYIAWASDRIDAAQQQQALTDWCGAAR
ncbi:MAG: FAD-dependent oxidoreductase [Stackebrandtia sp.]